MPSPISSPPNIPTYTGSGMGACAMVIFLAIFPAVMVIVSARSLSLFAATSKVIVLGVLVPTIILVIQLSVLAAIIVFG